MRFLLFTLYAPVCSLGEIAVGERRMSWARPGRSAVLGLAAAALGIERGDDDAHRRLDEGLHYAVRTDAPGRPFIDYHTTQTPRTRKDQRFAARREELAADGLHTILSRREWRSDACFTVALWARAGGNACLDEIASALRRPHFTLYLGRKSAPLGLPLDPEIVEAGSFVAALARRRSVVAADGGDAETRDTMLLQLGGDSSIGREIAFDVDAAGAPDGGRIERRRDGVVSRARWQFEDRVERITPMREGRE